VNEEPHPLVARLVGLAAPRISLPWTTYAYSHDLLGANANTSLAVIASYETLVAYFFPAESEDDPPDANTMSRVFRDTCNDIAQHGAQVVGVSTQTALAQQQIAAAESFGHLLLSDSEMKLADALRLPTVEIDGRDEYEPITTVIRDGRIARVVYPIASPRAHIPEVLAWLQNTASGGHIA
jgi:peroxiredoxin